MRGVEPIDLGIMPGEFVRLSDLSVARVLFF
jgi:hypothetical protein